MMRLGPYAILVAFSALTANTALAASFGLLRDVNPVAVAVSSQPAYLGSVGPRAVFTAVDPATGREPYASDGTPSGTVLLREFGTGANGVTARAAGPAGAVLTFFVETGSFTSPLELWATDGTPGGTTRIAAFDVAGGEWLGRLPDGTALVAAGRNLWRTDGTAAGTQRLNVGVPPHLPVRGTAAVGGRLYYFAGSAVQPAEIWETDGTAAGSRAVYRLPSGSNLQLEELAHAGARVLVATSSPARALHALDVGTQSLVQLAANLPDAPALRTRANAPEYAAFYVGAQVWRSDGTASGTFPLTSNGSSFDSNSLDPLLAIGPRVLFAFRPGAVSRQLWVTDGSITGTTALYDFAPDGGGFTQALTVGDGAAWFAVQSSATTPRIGVVRTDGTPAGTRLLEFADGRQRFDAQGAAPRGHWLGGRLVVAIRDTVTVGNVIDSAAVLYASDGTAPFARIFRGDRGGLGPEFAVAGNLLHFSASRAGSGLEPWATDGTEAGTRLPREIARQGANLGSNPREFARLGDALLFTADDGERGPELWRSDGTGAGTRLVRDIVAGTTGSNPRQPLAAGALVWFRASGVDGVSGLPLGVWRSDGTTDGTFAVFDPLGNELVRPPLCARWGAALGDAFAWLALDEGLRRWSLVRSDGTAAGTRRVVEFPEGIRGGCEVGSLGNRLLFWMGSELWSSDGTAAGTARLRAGRSGPPDEDGVFVRLGGVAVFPAFEQHADGVLSRVLSRTDGTAAGTASLAEQATGQAPTVLGQLAAFGDRALFVGASRPGTSSTTTTRGLFVTDGTVGGTRLVRGGLEIEGVPIASGGGRAFFVATEGSRRALWVSDGTAAGTRALVDVRLAGVADSRVFATDGPTLYFVATTAELAQELWMSDGTVAGTRRLAPLAPAGGDPEARVQISTLLPGRPFAAAVDPASGVEPHAVSNARPTAAADTGRVPAGSSVLLALTTNDTDPDGAINLAGVHVVGAAANGAVEIRDGGSVRYSPRDGFTGTDTFRYVAIDEWGGASEPATVTITVEAAAAPPPAPAPAPPAPPASGGGGGGGALGGGTLALLAAWAALRRRLRGGIEAGAARARPSPARRSP